MGGSEDTTLKGLEERLESLYSAMKLEVDDLYETVYKGNGKPSLVTRVNSVEGKLRGMREQMEEKFVHLDTQHALKFDSLHQKLENKFARLEGVLEQRFSNMEDIVKELVEVKKIDRTGSWQFKAAIITALAAVAATLLSFFIKS
tara:strand:+ start:200 stop:634 length:435 start_codon:yes stop_codon:yes gene_type:complete